MTDQQTRSSPDTASELLLCPFCGGEASHGYNGPGDGSGVMPAIFCASCGASVEGATFGIAIVRWNGRRPGTDAQTSRTQELERRVLAHEHLQARIVHALGRDTWQGDLAVAVEAEVNRANDNGKSCSEAFKVLRTIQDSAAEMLRMPWLQAPSLPSTDGGAAT